MNKKLNILFGFAFSFALSTLLVLPTFAESNISPSVSHGTISEIPNYDDDIMPISEDDEVTPINDESAPNNTTEDTTTYIECRGNNERSYCSNEYVCFPNSDGTQGLTCAYAATNNDQLPETYCIEDENGERICGRHDVFQNIIDEGTSGEGEVICATPGEPGCEDSDSELWPLILSLSALGATILFVIIINLFGHHSKKR